MCTCVCGFKWRQTRLAWLGSNLAFWSFRLGSLGSLAQLHLVAKNEIGARSIPAKEGGRHNTKADARKSKSVFFSFLFFSLFFEEKRKKRIENEEVLRCGWNDQLMLYPKSIAFYTFFPLFSFTHISFFLFFPVTRPTREIKKTKIGDEKERGKRAKGL